MKDKFVTRLTSGAAALLKPEEGCNDDNNSMVIKLQSLKPQYVLSCLHDRNDNS
jgi:hypothetical protein